MEKNGNFLGNDREVTQPVIIEPAWAILGKPIQTLQCATRLSQSDCPETAQAGSVAGHG
jgi:hypothetical protein